MLILSDAFNHCVLLCPVDGSVQSVMSFDQGGEWVPIQKPLNSQCDSTAADKEKVRGTKVPLCK